MHKKSPSPAAVNGRGPRGQFARGNRAGKGNPLSQRVQQLRTALMESVTPADLHAIIAKLVEKAREGDAVAAREVLDRTLGRPASTDILQRVEAIETLLQEKNV